MADSKDIKILAIVGMSGSGKSVIVDQITAMGVPKVYFGGMILKEMKKRDLEITPDNERDFREKIREKEGKDWVVRQAIAETNDLIEAGQKRIVLDGVYSWSEYRILKRAFPGVLTFIAVITSKPLRYERVARRPERPFDAKAIRERDISEIENLEKGGPIAAADYYILNDGTIEDTTRQLKAILTKINF